MNLKPLSPVARGSRRANARKSTGSGIALEKIESEH